MPIKRNYLQPYAERFISYRKGKKYSQTEMAEFWGVDRSVITRLENCTQLNAKLAIRLAALEPALGTTEEQIWRAFPDVILGASLDELKEANKCPCH